MCPYMRAQEIEGPYVCPYVCPCMCPYMCPYVCPYVCPYMCPYMWGQEIQGPAPTLNPTNYTTHPPLCALNLTPYSLNPNP